MDPDLYREIMEQVKAHRQELIDLINAKGKQIQDAFQEATRQNLVNNYESATIFFNQARIYGHELDGLIQRLIDITPIEGGDNMPKTIAIDFDGVINSYSSGWQGIDQLPDPPVAGAIAWLRTLISEGYDVCIFSSRSAEQRGIAAMKYWLVQWGMELEELSKYVRFPTTKPAAFLTIDDRCLTFQGVFPTMAEIEAFTPWHQKVVIENTEGIEPDQAV